MTVMHAGIERVASFMITSLCASAENPRPPNSFGMIMPRKRSRLMTSHAACGSSRDSHTSQSSTTEQSSFTGPSRNACSSAVSDGYGSLISFAKSGLPEKSSASAHTEPDSMAVRSVSEIVGMIGPRIFMTMLETSARRIGVMRKIAITAAYAASSQSGAPNPISITAPSERPEDQRRADESESEERDDRAEDPERRVALEIETVNRSEKLHSVASRAEPGVNGRH